MFKKLFITTICMLFGLMVMVPAHAAELREVNVSIESNINGIPFKILGVYRMVDGAPKMEEYFSGTLPFSGTLKLPDEKVLLKVAMSYPKDIAIYDEGDDKLPKNKTNWHVKLRLMDSHKVIAEEFEAFPKGLRKALVRVVSLYDLVYSPNTDSEAVIDERAQRAQAEYKMLLIDYPEFKGSITHRFVNVLPHMVLIVKSKYVAKIDALDDPGFVEVLKKAIGLV